MTKLPSMPFFPVDFFADTACMSGHAAKSYLFLLGHAWIRGGELPNDDKALARMARLTGSAWANQKKEILPFWTCNHNGNFENKRLSQELEYVRKKSTTNRENGVMGGRPKSLKSHNVTKANGFDSETQKKPNGKPPTPTPIYKKERDPRASALEFQQFWDLYGHKVDRPRAEKAMVKALEKATIERILDGVKSYRASLNDLKFIKDPAAWLNGERWNDQPAINGHSIIREKSVSAPLFFIREDTPQWNAWTKLYRDSGKIPPSPISRQGTHERGWHFPTEWPPK